MASRPLHAGLSLRLAFVALACVGVAGAVGWRVRGKLERRIERLIESRGLAASMPAHAPAPLGPPGTLDVAARPAGPRPRILLTPERLARLAAHRDAGDPQWMDLLRHCQKIVAEDWTAGYEAWDWGNAVLELGLCARMTHDHAFEAAGVRYFTALLDDRQKAGDRLGGDAVVTHDEGYSIRTHGFLGAIAYDWLHDVPGMTPALRKRAVDRFVAWTAWFKAHGYNHDNPISNYYAGYFGAVAFAGIACEGDDPRAAAFRQETQRMWNQEIVPTYRAKLTGGDFPEGWQYGDLVGSVFALYADAELTSHPAPAGAPAPTPLYGELPWLRDIVPLRAFELRPDGMHTYDNGDWNVFPPWSPPHALSILAMTLPRTDARAGQAEFLARLARAARDAPGDDWRWLSAVSEDASRPAEDPRKGQASYLSEGTATAFARSSFSPGSLWVSLTSEPSLSDHEHLDAGHFEVYRGVDPIFIDGGAYASYSSLSHNVVIVNDPLQSSDWETSRAHDDVIRYKKNQGTWSDTAHIARFEDGGGYVYALADYASAFNPKGWPDRRDRAVTRAERELLFSRAPVAGAGPGETGRVVVYDRFTLSDSRFTTTFILHGGPVPPRITGPVALFTSGASAAWVTTLAPAGAKSGVADESHNTDSEDKPYLTNAPPHGVASFRYEVASPASPASTERRFLHAIVVGAGGGAAAPVRSVEGDQVAGAVIDGEAYVFSRSGPATQATPLSYRAPKTATRHIVADLAPSAGYAVVAAVDGDGCRVSLTPGPMNAGKTASAKGMLVLLLGGEGCEVR